ALAAATLMALPAAAVEHGPAPTPALLEGTGPYAIASYKIPAATAKPLGYGGATVHYPTGAQGQTFGVVAMMPGFLAFQAVYDGLVKKFASHGFVVANLDSLAPGDFPDVRAATLAAGLKHVVEL